MKHKLLIAAMALAMGSAAYAADSSQPAYQETPEGDPKVLQQGEPGTPTHPQVRDLEGGPEIARQGQEGQPASAEPNFQLGPQEIDQAGAQTPEPPTTTNAFYTLDRDADGYLSQEEADETLRAQWGEADRDANGKVDESEFSAFETMRVEQPASPQSQSGDPQSESGAPSAQPSQPSQEPSPE